MARKLIVEIIGDTRSLERSFGRASSSANKFEKSMTHATRGVISGSGAFNHLGRSLAFASGGFIAFAGVTHFLTESIDAAREAQKAQASLAAQMKAAGESFKDNQKRVEAASLAYGKFGFENDEVTRSITVLERGTGNITRALGLQTTAANLARAKNLDLAAASNVLAKVFGGQETALRRAVPGLEKSAHGMDLIREASRKLAGQAAANTTEAERFNAILHNTKEIIGTALLPILDKYLVSVGNWLDKMNRSGELQKDVNSAVRTATGLFSTLKDLVSPLVGGFKALGDAVGGTKNEVVLLIAAFVAFKTQAKLAALLGIASGLTGIGSAAAGAKAQTLLLRTALMRLAGIGLITIAIELVLNRKQLEDQIRGAIQAATTPGAPSPVGLPFSRDPLDTRPNTSGRVPTIHFNFPGGPGGTAAGVASQARSAAIGLPTGVHGGGIQNPPLTAAQKLQLGLAAHPDDIALLRQQAAHDRAAVAFADKLLAEHRISNKKYVAEVSAYQSDLAATLDHINQITSAAAKAVTNRLRANIPGHVSDEAFGNFRFNNPNVPGAVHGTGFGFGAGFHKLRSSFGQSLALQLAAAKAGVTPGGEDDLSVVRKMKKAAERALKSGTLAIRGQIDAWNAIADANDKLHQNIKGDVTKFTHMDVGRSLRGLNLSPAQLRELRTRFSVVGAGGTVPGTPSPAFSHSGGVYHIGTVNLHGVQNPEQLESLLEKRARSRAPIRRGA